MTVQWDSLPDGPFDVIVTDPPWMYQKAPGAKGAAAGANGIAEKHYATMSMEELQNMPVSSIAAADCHLFMWVTNPHLFGGRFSRVTARDLVEAWGFRYKTLITWVKTTQDGSVAKNGLGWYFRGATEHVVYATRGNVRIPSELREPNVFLAPRGQHSAKPDGFMELVERVTTGPRIELFARRARDGWSSWGNEVER